MGMFLTPLIFTEKGEKSVVGVFFCRKKKLWHGGSPDVGDLFNEV